MAVNPPYAARAAARHQAEEKLDACDRGRTTPSQSHINAETTWELLGEGEDDKEASGNRERQNATTQCCIVPQNGAK
jgi:hypothetical protein